MKITLDLTQLVASGALSATEAERLQQLALAETGSLGINILLACGIVGVALGLGVLIPTPLTALSVGLVVLVLGLWLKFRAGQGWRPLAETSIAIGALGLATGTLLQFEGNLVALGVVALGFAITAVLARSGLLATAAVLTLAGMLGAVTGNASTEYWTSRPALTVVAFSALTLALYLVSLRVKPAEERLAIIAARTAILIINAAFLVGSLFGDNDFHWSRLAFGIAWALLLVGIGVWAIRENRRWVVNMAAIFGAIHFFTQWFEWLELSAGGILVGGLLLIAFGLVLRAYNRPAPPPAALGAGTQGVALGGASD